MNTEAKVVAVLQTNALYPNMVSEDIDKGTLMICKSRNIFGLYSHADERGLYLEGSVYHTERGDSPYDSIVINGFAPYDIHFTVHDRIVASTRPTVDVEKPFRKIPNWFVKRYASRQGLIIRVDLNKNCEIERTIEWTSLQFESPAINLKPEIDGLEKLIVDELFDGNFFGDFEYDDVRSLANKVRLMIKTEQIKAVKDIYTKLAKKWGEPDMMDFLRQLQEKGF